MSILSILSQTAQQGRVEEDCPFLSHLRASWQGVRIIPRFWRFQIVHDRTKNLALFQDHWKTGPERQSGAQDPPRGPIRTLRAKQLNATIAYSHAMGTVARNGMHRRQRPITVQTAKNGLFGTKVALANGIGIADNYTVTDDWPIRAQGAAYWNISGAEVELDIQDDSGHQSKMRLFR